MLRPGAAALLSVQGEHAYRLFRSGSMNVSANLMSRLTAHKPLSTEPFIYEQYDHFAPGVGEFSGMDDSYGLTFHSEAYLKERWGELFEIVAVLPASVDRKTRQSGSSRKRSTKAGRLSDGTPPWKLT